MTIQQAVNNFKELINDAIINNGESGKRSIIRSSRPILNVHEAVKHDLVRLGVNQDMIHPELGARSPELKLAGVLKKKNQDVAVVPEGFKTNNEILEGGLLDGEADEYGQEYTERTISVNIRSQISSLKKNFDTLYERTASEAQNLHDRCPKMVLGEVYMIAIPEYDDQEVKNNRVRFKTVDFNNVEHYITAFEAINERTDIEGNYYKYESACLLIVDFSQDEPKIYETTEELVENGYLHKHSEANYEPLAWNRFTKRLLRVHKERFT